MKKMTGQSFSEVKLHRSDMVVTQSSNKSVRVRNKEAVINPHQLFNRILCVRDSPAKLKSYFEFELASHPPTLFDDVSLKKGKKAFIMKAYDGGIVDINLTKDEAAFILYGGDTFYL